MIKHKYIHPDESNDKLQSGIWKSKPQFAATECEDPTSGYSVYVLPLLNYYHYYNIHYKISYNIHYNFHNYHIIISIIIRILNIIPF